MSQRVYQQNVLFTNALAAARSSLAMYAHAESDEWTVVQTYKLRLAAAPLREILVSTTSGSAAGALTAPTNYVGAGD